MPRSAGTYTAPSSSVNPAVEGTTIDETDFNSLVDDIETAFTESTYTSGLGSADNQLVRTDGTDTKKVQGTGITVDDSNNVSGVGTISSGAITSSGAIGNGTSGVTSTGTIELGHASDTTLARSGAGDVTIEGNAIYRAGGTDVPITDGGTGASTAAAAFDALAPTTTQGDIIYRNASGNVRLATGTAGQVLISGGAGANPSWGAAGSGDLVAANNLSDVASAATAATNLGLGTGSSPQFTAVNIGHATDTTITRTGAGDIAVEGNAVYRAGGTDVAIADGGTGAGTAAAGFRALAEGVGSTQGDILYRSGTEWTALGTGTVGQVLSAGGAGANPSWTTPAGTGDVTAASTIADNRVVRGDGGAKGIQQSGLTIDDSDNVSGLNSLRFADAKGISDSSGNEHLVFQETASAVNEWEMTNAATAGKPVLAVTGGDTNIIGRLNGKGTGGIEIEGTATNDNASAGYVGEYVSATVELASAVTLTTSTRTDITSISLTAGDWDVEGNVEMSNTGGPTVTTLLAWVHDVSVTLPTGLGTEGGFVQWRGSTTSNPGTCTGSRRYSITATTTVYLQCQSAFTGGTNAKAYGLIRARRVR